MGMQDTISQLAEIIQLQMAMPSSAEDRQDLRLDAAMRMLQEIDDGLTVDEKTDMVMLFQCDATAASTFIKLTDDSIRRNWLRKMLELLNRGQQQQQE
jgi:hypothetical protein